MSSDERGMVAVCGAMQSIVECIDPDVAIRVSNLSKCYQIYNKPSDRLLQMFSRGQKQYYREFWALKDVSFEIKKGETVGIIGRNGSGKSTLLQLICGTLNPSAGNVQVSGRVAALLELGSGFNHEFTGRENIYINGSLLGLSKQDIDNRFDDIAAFADIGGFIDQPVKTYSSGMSVRLAFSVQAMIDPEILIVDEALAVGDEKFQRKCFGRLEELKNNGTSILFVSHSGPQIVELCERALFLERGERVMYGKPLSVVKAYQKLIYSPVSEQQVLIAQYCSADSSVVPDEIFERELFREPTSVSRDTFDVGLKPETTTVYPVQGAKIESFEIQDVDGRAVNILTLGQQYRFIVSGRFLSDASHVYFGIHIRSISGMTITGQRHPEDGRYIEKIGSGESFKISFAFTMALLPGTYFVGGGVWSAEQPNCLHRILDALMFRITPVLKNKSFGFVDLSASEVILEFI